MTAGELTRILGAPVQIAYAVPDAGEAARRWARDLGAGPFFVRPHIELVDVVVRGLPGTFDHTAAYGQWGPMMVELVQDHGGAGRPVGDVYGAGETGVHHLAFVVEDYEVALEVLLAQGHEVALSARTRDGVEFCYVDTVASYGHLLELYRASDRLRSFYATVAAAAVGWDGTDPVRWR